ncbi:hypothetical protein AN191_16595 [Loktanella sp. 5RATIMAR09]|nr:hypothetical protein AN191_16595 [Loktanella sp. 5RATIMAR09]
MSAAHGFQHHVLEPLFVQAFRFGLLPSFSQVQRGMEPVCAPAKFGATLGFRLPPAKSGEITFGYFGSLCIAIIHGHVLLGCCADWSWNATGA